MILVDTSVWVDFFRGVDTPQRRILHRLIDDQGDVAITELILTEILQGIRRDRDFRNALDSLLRLTMSKPSGTDTYVRAAEIYRDCRRRGQTVRRTVECVIAAVCLEHGLSLLHRDADFDRIASVSGLRIVAL